MLNFARPDNITLKRIRRSGFLALACACWLVSAASALGQNLSLAARFDLTDDELVALFNSTDGLARIENGVLLADIWASDYGPDRARTILMDLPSDDEIEQVAGRDFADYARSVRWSVLLREGELERAIAIGEPVMTRALDIDQPFLRARVFDAASFLSALRGLLRDAYSNATQSAGAAVAAGSDYGLSRSLANQALTMHFSGLYADSVGIFQQALEQSKGVPHRSISSVISFNMGLGLLESEDYAGALRAFTSGAQWADSVGRSHRSIVAHTYRAKALLKLGRADEALAALERTIATEGEQADPDSLAHAYIVTALARVALGQLQAAHESIDAGLKLADRQSNVARQRQLRLARVDVLEAQARTDEALQLARSIAASPEDAGGPEQLEALYAVARLAARSGDFETAYRVNMRAIALEAAVKGESYAQRLAMLATANEVNAATRLRDQAQAREQQLRQRSRLSTAFLLGIITILGLTILAGYLNRERRTQRRIAHEQARAADELEHLVAARNKALEKEMTERLASERERDSLQNKLGSEDKLRALGQLTGGVAHDFNNLLTVINGAAELLLKKPDLSTEERHGLAQAILSAGDTGAKVSRGLLAYARRQPLRPEVFDVQQHLRSQQRLLQQTVGDDMTLNIVSEPALVEVDRAALTTAIINLLSNARDASDGRGQIDIRLRASSNETGDHVCIDVRDFGCGMTSEAVARASEPFYSTKKSAVATGLGLSSVHGFIHQSGGYISIESSPGNGTLVRLGLPPAEAGDGDLVPSETLLSAKARARILLVDDNRAVASMLARMLGDLGHETLTASDTDEVLSMLKSEVPDLLISDVVMPGRYNGVELAKVVSERWPSVRILLLSGYVDRSDMPFPFLAKPFSQSALASKLNEVLAGDIDD